MKPKKLTIEKSNKFDINYPYIALLPDSDIPKLQFCYTSYNLNIGPIICSLYAGKKFVYNIISFVDKSLTAKLEFDEEKIDEDSKKLIPFFSIKSIIDATEPIPLSFTVPNETNSLKNKNFTLKGHLQIFVKESEIEPLSIDFTFNVILLPLEIYFLINNDNIELFWNQNKLSLKNNILSEDENYEFQYFIRNFNEKDYSNFIKNLSLKSLANNEVDNKPEIK